MLQVIPNHEKNTFLIAVLLNRIPEKSFIFYSLLGPGTQFLEMNPPKPISNITEEVP